MRARRHHTAATTVTADTNVDRPAADRTAGDRMTADRTAADRPAAGRRRSHRLAADQSPGDRAGSPASRARGAATGDVSVESTPPVRVRLPGFVSDDDVGLGDAIGRVTRAFGVAPCEQCKRRAAVLNRWLVFRGRAR